MTPETEALIARTLEHDTKMTAAPWRFEVNRKSNMTQLCGGKPRFDKTVIDLRRWGMSSADLRFRAGNGLMVPAAKLCTAIPGREHHAHWCATIAHPDAVGIEDFRTAAPKLARMLREAIKGLQLDETRGDTEETLAEIERIAKGES